jgi:5-hydroxyisourate hydrolase
MPGKLTTHVLDTSRGLPAAGMKISLYRDDKLLQSAITNRDGRLDAPLLAGAEFGEGNYRLEFAVGDYFASKSESGAGRFLDIVPIAFRVDGSGRDYHVPLLVSPWSYTIYRGS